MWDDARALNALASAGYAAAGLLLACAILWRVAQLDHFAVREITISGDAAHLTLDQVEAVAFRHLRGNFFTMDLESARDAFEKLPWVRQVEVSRRWPDRIEFEVEEHQPLARWGESALVNEYGEVFQGASNRRLPVFSGPEGSAQEVVQRYVDFERTLATVGRRIEEVRLSPRRAWRLKLDDSTVIELGRDNMGQRLATFVAAYGRGVGLPAGPALHVDLRYANGFAVRARAITRSDRRA
jgi:cell division protein FtsQ